MFAIRSEIKKDLRKYSVMLTRRQCPAKQSHLMEFLVKIVVLLLQMKE